MKLSKSLSLRAIQQSTRSYSATSSTPLSSPFAPRHLLSIADLTPKELTTLVHRAYHRKQQWKSGTPPGELIDSLKGDTIALTFTKRSTRTRVSTESAIAKLGGHPMFLGSSDIQLGVNESLHDTSVIISSMTKAIFARVNGHEDVAGLAKHSSVPVINALSDLYHPLQTIADYLTVYETFKAQGKPAEQLLDAGLGLDGLKIAWVGDANNVLYDLAIGAMKLGIDIAVATPKGYEIPAFMRDIIHNEGNGKKLLETNEPEAAVKDADIIVTDTWISMGQEDEKVARLKAFEGFQVTADLAKRGGAKEDWRFMHCLPRHPEEVDDAVFFSPKSLVFQEGENRLWAAIAALEAFVVNGGRIS